MIKIVVCDDKLNEITKVNKLLDEFNATIMTIDVKTFTSSLDLSRDINQIKSTDIFLLDIVMPDLLGIELGKLIRLHNTDASIILLTTSTDYALDAYGIQALHYLLKPIQKNDLFEALKKAALLANKKESFFSIQSRTGLIPLKVKDIQYVEYKDHYLYFFVNDEVIQSKFFRSAFRITIEPLFTHSDFILTHRAYLINMNHVRKMDKHSFEMDNHKRVPISNSKLSEVRKTYMSFLIREE